MAETDWLTERFEEHRPRLRGVAYRMLGSLDEADDALQDAWLRVSKAGADGVENLGGWLTTVVARVCLNMLRSRATRRETSDGRLPDPIVTPLGDLEPEQEVLLADSVGLALQVVLETLTPAERLAFVLHDLFELPFDEIAPIVGRSPDAARQLASRARRRVRGADTGAPEPDLVRQQLVLEAFYRAARQGDLEALVGLLDPDVVLRTDAGTGRPHRAAVIRGAEAVARQARLGASPESDVHRALVNGAYGAVITRKGRPFAVMAFAVVRDRITEIDIIMGAERVGRVAASVLSSFEA